MIKPNFPPELKRWLWFWEPWSRPVLAPFPDLSTAALSMAASSSPRCARSLLPLAMAAPQGPPSAPCSKGGAPRDGVLKPRFLSAGKSKQHSPFSRGIQWR